MTITLFKERNFANALRGVILIGILLAVYQYIFNRSLWIDEASLALNVINKSFGELLQPLDYRQVAPIGFLYFEKLCVNIFGGSEYALRLFPLLSFIASIFLFTKLSRELIADKLFALAAVAMFSINVRSIYFSSEVKQYSTEVLMCIAILLSMLQFAPESRRSLFVLVLVGSISIWFSSAAVVILFVCGLYLLYKHTWIGRDYRTVIPVVFWVISFVVYYFMFIYHHPHTEYMQSWWSRWFFPMGSDFRSIFEFVHTSMLGIFSFHARLYYVWIIPAFVTLLSVICLVINRRSKELYFLLVPGFVHLILSAFAIYPFAERLTLYLMPLTLMLYAWGLHYLWRMICRKVVELPAALVITVAFMGLVPWLFMNFPLEKQEMKAGIKMIVENIEEGDNVYIFGSGKRSFQYYHEKDALLAGHHILTAKNYYINVEKSAQDIMSLSGNTWLAFAFYKGTKRGEPQHPGHMLDWLAANGYTVLFEQNFTGCRIYEIHDNRTE